MASLGWFGLGLPEAYGGMGLGFRELALLYEELGSFLTPLPTAATLLAADAILAAGSDAQKRRWLAPLAAGEIRAGFALPTAAVEMPQLGDGNVLSGTLTDVLQGDQVDELVVPVLGAGGRLSLAVVGASQPGVEVRPRPIIDLTRTLADVSFSEVRIGPERVMTLEPRTWTRLLDHASLAIACDAVGGAGRILADTVTYLGVRRQFDRPIGAFQALKHRVASWKIAVEAAGALTRHCAELIADGEHSRSALSSAAKASATETYLKVAGDAVQLHGGIGFTWEHDCHLFLKRAALDAVLFGGVMQHKDRAAELAFGGVLGIRTREHVPLQRFFSRPD